MYNKLIVSTYNCTSANNYTKVESELYKQGVATNLSGFNKIYSISYMWLSPIGILSTIFIGILVSLITNKIFAQFKIKEVDDSLILYRFLFSKKKKELSDK